MNYDELTDIVKTGEGYTIELKESAGSSVGKDICAFANSSGGKIILGADDDGHIMGFTLTNPHASKIQDIARNMNPPFNVRFETESNFGTVFYWVAEEIRSKSEADPKQIGQKSDANRTDFGRRPDANARRTWILEYLTQKHSIKSSVVIEHFDIAKDTASRDLKALIKENKIVKKGRGNNVWYELKEEET